MSQKYSVQADPCGAASPPGPWKPLRTKLAIGMAGLRLVRGGSPGAARSAMRSPADHRLLSLLIPQESTPDHAHSLPPTAPHRFRPRPCQGARHAGRPLRRRPEIRSCHGPGPEAHRWAGGQGRQERGIQGQEGQDSGAGGAGRLGYRPPNRGRRRQAQGSGGARLAQARRERPWARSRARPRRSPCCSISPVRQ